MYRKLCVFVFACLFSFSFAARAAIDAAADTSSDALGSSSGLSTGAKVGIAAGATALVGGAVIAVALAASDKSGSGSDNNGNTPLIPVPDTSPLIPLNYPDQPLIPLNPAIQKLHHHLILIANPFDETVVMGEWNDQAIYDGTPYTSQDGKFTRYIANPRDPITASAAPNVKDRQWSSNNVTFDRKLLYLDILAYTFLQVQPKLNPKHLENANYGNLYFADPWSDVSLKGLPWFNLNKDDTFCQDAPTKIICNYALNGQNVSQYGRGNFEAFSHLAGKAGMKKVFAVGGPGNFTGIVDMLGYDANSEAAQDRFITSAIEILQHYKLDGIDIDFELPYGQGFNSTKGTLYADFLQKLRNALDQQFGTGADRKLILITIPADQRWIDSVNTGDKTPDNWALISDAVNAVVIRTYDFHGGFDANGKIKKTGYTISTSADANSPYTDQNSNDYSLIGSVKRLSKYVPYNKIIASIPAYGRAVQNVTSPTAIFQLFSGKTPAGDMDVNGCYSSNTCTGKFSYKYIVQNVLPNNNFITTDNLTVYGAYSYYVDIINKWSPPELLPPGLMLKYATPFISYADTSVATAAAKYAKSAKLGGMMLAYISGDVDPFNDASKSLLIALQAIR